MITRHYTEIPGYFIHPVCEKEVVAGEFTFFMCLENLDGHTQLFVQYNCK